MIHSGKSVVCTTNDKDEHYNSITNEYLVLTNTSDYNNDQQVRLLQAANMNPVGQSEDMERFTELCRICANASDHMISIFEGEGAQHELSSKIHKYLPIRISESDTLSLYMCYHCASTLLAWHDLLEGCLDAEQKLLRMQAESNCQEEEKFVFTIPETNEANEVIKAIQTTQSDVVEIKSLSEATTETKDNQIVESDTVINDRYQTGEVILGENRIVEPNDKITIEMRCRKFGMTCSNMKLLYHDINNENNSIPVFQGSSKELYDFMRNYRKEFTNYKSGVLPFKSMMNIQESYVIKKQRNVEEINENKERELINKAKTIIDSKVVYWCNDCNKQLLTRRGYIRHIRFHSDHRPCVCVKCDKKFRVKQDLVRHINDVHDGRKKYICDICKRAFANKNARDDHRRIHTGEKPYTCEKCQKTFRTLNCLYIHNRGHSNYKPHTCTTCDKCFCSKQRLNNHMTTHTGVKAFLCEFCGKTFSVKSHAARHRVIHNIEKPFKCTICGMNFGQIRYIRNHIKTRHKEQSTELLTRLNVEQN